MNFEKNDGRIIFSLKSLDPEVALHLSEVRNVETVCSGSCFCLYNTVVRAVSETNQMFFKQCYV